MRSSLRAFGSPTAQHITTMPKALRHCMRLKLDGLWEPMGLCLHTNMFTSSYMPDQYWLIIWSVTDFWAIKLEELGNPELPPTWKKWAVKPAPEGIGDCCMICGWSITVRFMSPNHQFKKMKINPQLNIVRLNLSPLRSLGKRNVRSKFCA